MQNHFDLFQLPQQFAIDPAALDAAYREVQGRVHPDRFVNASDAEKRVAMQWATRANEAYQTLKKPLKRAAYLCELNGVGLQADSNTAMPAAFLMQQMEWREELEEARAKRDLAALEALDAALRKTSKEQIALIGSALDGGDFPQAAQGVRQLMFLEKFGEEVSDAFEVLEV
jgi:molecular chaperone HscB